jgi:hypothetical protein
MGALLRLQIANIPQWSWVVPPALIYLLSCGTDFASQLEAATGCHFKFRARVRDCRSECCHGDVLSKSPANIRWSKAPVE